MANSNSEEKWYNYTPHRHPASKIRMLRTDACPLPAGERVQSKLDHGKLDIIIDNLGNYLYDDSIMDRLKI